jgi:hypothetical protein
MRLLIASSMAVVALAFAAIGTAQGASGFKKCGKAGDAQNVQAKNIRCRFARTIARSHASNCNLKKKTCYVGDYKCVRKFFGNSGTRVRCTSPPAVIKFFYGS